MTARTATESKVANPSYEGTPGEDPDDQAPMPAASTADAQESDTNAVDTGAGNRRRRTKLAPRRWAQLAGLTILTTLIGLNAWLGWNVYQVKAQADHRAQFLQAAREGAVNLTTIDWQHADSDVQRILNSATGTFHDDFAKRSQPFIDALRQSQSKSEGTIIDAGLESSSSTDAQALVAVNVKISDITAPEQKPRSWRMRISVHRAGNDVSVSNVEFVP